MTRTRIFRLAGVLAVLVASMTVAAAQAAPGDVTPAQLKSGFKKATGQKLVVDKLRSSAGRYTAFNLGVQTFTKQARYGTFTIFLVSGGDVATDVQSLLKNPHTGELDPAAPGGIYWEQDSSLGGQLGWMAKHRYGSNLVLWWTGSEPVKKTDRTFKTLHKALVAVTKQKS